MLEGILPQSSDSRRVSPSKDDILEYVERVAEIVASSLPTFGFRGISLPDIPCTEDRKLFGDLVSTLQEDLGRKVDLGIRYRPKLTSEWTSREMGYLKESWVVQPRYLVRDSRRRGIKKPIIFEAGDGNFGGSLPTRLLTLFGLLKKMPDNLGYVHIVNEDYFPKGSQAREVLSQHGGFGY